jgi:hypothetical protein
MSHNSITNTRSHGSVGSKYAVSDICYVPTLRTKRFPFHAQYISMIYLVHTDRRNHLCYPRLNWFPLDFSSLRYPFGLLRQICRCLLNLNEAQRTARSSQYRPIITHKLYISTSDILQTFGTRPSGLPRLIRMNHECYYSLPLLLLHLMPAILLRTS